MTAREFRPATLPSFAFAFARHHPHQEPSMQFIPYLNFNGNCAEAFAFYARLFGGTIVHQSTFGETPGFEQMPEAGKNLIMHAHLHIKDHALIPSHAPHTPPGSAHPPAPSL